MSEALNLEPGPARILIVEDEPKLAALLADYLRAAGHETEHIADGAAVLAAYASGRHDLILLDLMLPGVDGLTLCRSLRAQSSVPIVMLTARADDYIAKNPFSPREVVARVKAVLRRARPAANTASPLQIDEPGLRASWQGQALDLTPIEFRLLRTLAGNPGRVYARAQLLDQVHEDGRAVTERAVDSHVKNLRRKLEAAGAGDCIRSVYGVGYRYEL